jgi:hypothetical protein
MTRDEIARNNTAELILFLKEPEKRIDSMPELDSIPENKIDEGYWEQWETAKSNDKELTEMYNDISEKIKELEATQ